MPLSNVTGAASLSRPGVCTSTSRPASPYDGQMIYETDTDRVMVWNDSAWVPTFNPDWLQTTNTSLSNTVAAFNAERNGVPGVGAKYAFGNGSSAGFISFPFACKLITSTFTATTDINGTITVRPWLDAGLVGTAAYDMSISAANSLNSYNFLSNPLSIPANQRFSWECTASTATVSTSVITFYIRFD